MSCPYPNCAGEGVVALSWCQSCTQPLLVCTDCGNDNRTLARYCRNCGKPIPAGGLSVDTFVKEKILPRRLGEVRGRSASILSYGGYVWLMSAHGELYKASSGANQLVRCATFREGGFSFPLNLELDDNGPVIYTNNHHSVFSYSVLSAKFEKLLELEDGNSRLVSGVVKRGKDFYYLTQETAANSKSHLTLNSSGNKLSYLLGSVTLHGSAVSPLQYIGDDLWVITREKVFVFRNSIELPKEFSWNPWRVWVTSKGVLYSEKVRTGVGGTTQSIWRLTFGGGGFEQYSLAVGLSLTTRIATSQDGQAVLFTHSGIEVFDAAMNSVEELTGIVQVHNPQGILLSRPFIFWFETSDRSVRAWEIGESKVYSVWSFTGETINFSEFLLSGSSLYGFTEEEVWRWDLRGS